jgi:hypothetical protein
MFERQDNFDDYCWTAKRFEFLCGKNEEIGLIEDVVNNFVAPIVNEIKYGENPLCKRNYWSWVKDPKYTDSPNIFIRLYFLCHNNDKNKIWSFIEKNRKQNFNTKLKKGIDEPSLSFSDEDLERGLILDYNSEIALRILVNVGLPSKLAEAFHFLVEPLWIDDKEGQELLRNNVGLGKFITNSNES